MKDLYIIGAGGVGEEVALIVESINAASPTWNLKGFVDENTDLLGTAILDGVSVVSSLKEILQTEEEIYVSVAISNPLVKARIVRKIKRNKNIKFATLIHPSVPLNRTIQIGEGSIIYSNVILSSNIVIGEHVLLSPKVGVGHGSRISNFCSLLWNVNISGNVVLLESVLIGSSATILQNLVVSEMSVVGACALVNKNVDACNVVVGIPARVLK